MNDNDYNKLNNKIDHLINLCNTLHKEKVILLAERNKWQEKAENLIEIKKQAKLKVLDMIKKLRASEK